MRRSLTDVYHHTIPVLEAADGLAAMSCAPIRAACSTWRTGSSSRRSFARDGRAAAADGNGRVGDGRRIGDRPRVPQRRWLRPAPPSSASISAPHPPGCRRRRRHRDNRRGSQCPTRHGPAYGGVDIAVLAAGVFGKSEAVGDLDEENWRATMDVNVDANARLLRELHPLLARSLAGGRRRRLVEERRRAGPRRPAYSASKAALTQLARVAALEWAQDGTASTSCILTRSSTRACGRRSCCRARSREAGVDVETYKRRNLLGLEITSADVARAVVALSTTRSGRRQARRSRSTAATSASSDALRCPYRGRSGRDTPGGCHRDGHFTRLRRNSLSRRCSSEMRDVQPGTLVAATVTGM